MASLTMYPPLVLCLHKTISHQILETKSDFEAWYIFVNCKTLEQRYTIANIYAQNQEQLLFLSKVLDDLTAFEQGLIILCGHINIPLQPALDTPCGHSVLTFNKLNKIKKIINSIHICEAWRLRHLYTWDYTFYLHAYDSYSRIVCILLQHPLLAKLIKPIGTILHSDHALIWRNLDLI